MISLKVRGYRGTGFGSSFITWWTRSSTSHVSLVFDLGHGEEEEIEAIQGKGVITHLPYTHDEKTFTEWVAPLSYEQILDAHILATSLVGSRYDWSAIRAFIQHRKRHSPDKWICSELVAYCLMKSGYALSRRKPYLETPSTVVESLRLVEVVGDEAGGA